MQIGESLLTHGRSAGEANIVAFDGLSGGYCCMYFDENVAKNSPFGKRIVHGYFVLSAAAGLFVTPGPCPVWGCFNCFGSFNGYAEWRFTICFSHTSR